jgi:hypothetical protein
MRNKELLVIILLLISITFINAQHTVNFKKNGTYIVKNGISTEIILENISLPYFFDDYLIF